MRYLALLAALVAALCFAASASAGDWSDARLDVIATAVAGVPTHVYCENDFAEWDSISVNIVHSLPEALYGFTYPTVSTANVYMQPHICQSLHVALTYGPEEVGAYWFSLAAHVLDHEAMHKRLRSFDEGLVDCSALSTDPQVLRDYWHIPATVPQTYVSSKIVRRHGKRVRVPVLRTTQVANPFLAHVFAWDQAWHKSLPQQYQGTC